MIVQKQPFEGVEKLLWKYAVNLQENTRVKVLFQ